MAWIKRSTDKILNKMNKENDKWCSNCCSRVCVCKVFITIGRQNKSETSSVIYELVRSGALVWMSEPNPSTEQVTQEAVLAGPAKILT